jgi:hypothetical protein
LVWAREDEPRRAAAAAAAEDDEGEDEDAAAAKATAATERGGRRVARRAASAVRRGCAGGHSPPDAHLASVGEGPLAGTRHRDRCRAVDAAAARMVVQRARVAGLPRSLPRRTARCAPTPSFSHRHSQRCRGTSPTRRTPPDPPSRPPVNSAPSGFGRTYLRPARRSNLGSRTGGRDSSNHKPGG